MSHYHKEHPDMEPDAATERLYEMADRLHDEMRDRAWERALARDALSLTKEAGPWDERDAFSLAKEYEFFEEQRQLRENASQDVRTPIVAP